MHHFIYLSSYPDAAITLQCFQLVDYFVAVRHRTKTNCFILRFLVVFFLVLLKNAVLVAFPFLLCLCVSVIHASDPHRPSPLCTPRVIFGAGGWRKSRVSYKLFSKGSTAVWSQSLEFSSLTACENALTLTIEHSCVSSNVDFFSDHISSWKMLGHHYPSGF